MASKKIGSLGCGLIAELGHLPAITHANGLTAHAVYNIDWQRALAIPNRFHVAHAFPTEEEFWASDIDAVVICSPAALHQQHVLSAAKHGKHVLCEKPLATNAEDILVMKHAMEDARLMFFTGEIELADDWQDTNKIQRELPIGDRFTSNELSRQTNQSHLSTGREE